MTRTNETLADRPVIVGSGIAGLLLALSLAPRPVVLVTRAALGEESSTGWAQGGIAAAVGPDNGIDRHIADTIAAGAGLVDVAAATAILNDAPRAVAALEAAGVLFDRTADGAYAFGLEAAHSRRRILHAHGDATGAEVIRALTAAVRARPSIAVIEGMEARRILTTAGVVSGLACTGPQGAMVLPTPVVVLATGGVGGLFERSTNPTGNYGPGLMMAARAGARLADMEFVQFHPTALASDRRPLALVSEAVRGEGAILLDAAGKRFMADIPGAELAPRDQVARAVAAAIDRTGGAFLDARAALGERFADRFPTITAACKEIGVDPACDLIPVAPVAHYHMGGVATDLRGRSSLAGLWAVGEAGCTGLHGANRLASNSLLEGAVMACRAAADIAALPRRPVRLAQVPTLPADADIGPARAIVSRYLGVNRDGAGLSQAVDELLKLVREDGPAADPAVVGLMMAVAALERRESRGAHSRSDYPALAAPVRRSQTLAEAVAAAGARPTQQISRSA